MARSLNKVTLIGRLGRDPEMRYTASGTAVTTFTIATNRFRQGVDGGQGQEETDWHTIVTWDKLAETCNQFLTKGRMVYVEGSLQTRSWEQDGQKRYKTEVVAREMIILDTKDRNGGEGGDYDRSSAPAERRQPALVAVGADQELDDLPF
jgi:single-strand DNA-binding protein